MSLFRRLFKPKTPTVEQPPREDHAEALGLLLLAAREKRDDSLRHSPRMGELLGLLWQDTPQALKAVHTAFNSVERLDREYVAALARRVVSLQPTHPPTPEGRYDAVVEALRLDLSTIPAPATEQRVPSVDTRHSINTLTLARILLPPELHQPICTFLVAYNKVYPPSPNEGAHQQLVRENIFRFLASIPPQAMPAFWAMVREEAVSQEFWPALRRIRDRNAVPYLLELLPAAEEEEGHSPMSLDGQKEVILVLREIGDLRAVPVLVAMEKRPLPPPVEKPGIPSAWDRALSKAWRERNELAQMAGQAARHILRNSGEAETQPLRASNPPLQKEDTRLRSSPPNARSTASGERMRHAEASEKTNEIL